MTSKLKWARSPVGCTSNANIDTILLTAWSEHAIAPEMISVHGTGETLDEAEAAAEAKLLEAYVTLRECFDPAPVLQWENATNTRRAECVARFLVEKDHPLYAWRLIAREHEFELEFRRNGHYGSAETRTIEANQHAAEQALSSYGVRFKSTKEKK